VQGNSERILCGLLLLLRLSILDAEEYDFDDGDEPRREGGVDLDGEKRERFDGTPLPNLDPVFRAEGCFSEGNRRVEGKSASSGKAGTGLSSMVVRPSYVNEYLACYCQLTDSI
jgi:hypothetical protein